MIDWNDIPFFIAVAESGTLNGAANKLSVNHSTVYRRINTLEKKLGTHLFDRFQDGYSLTETGSTVMEYALNAESSIRSFERTADGEDYRLTGRILLTAPSSSLASDYLAPCISLFRKKHPGINIDLIVSDELQDLSRREADIALRVTQNPPEFLIGRKVCNIRWDAYASMQYINIYGRPKSMKDLGNHKLIGTNGKFLNVPAYKSFNEMHPNENYVCRASDLLTISALGTQGVGVIILPSNFKNHSLVKLFKITPNFDEQLWILIHPELQRSTRINVFSDYLHKYLKKQDFHTP